MSQVQQSYEEGSSQEIIIEFGQNQYDLVNSQLTQTSISGTWGCAELYRRNHERLVVYEGSNQISLKCIDTIYRGFVIKTQRKEKLKSLLSKNDQVKNGISIEEYENRNEQNLQEQRRDEPESLFESSPQEQKPLNKRIRIKKLKTDNLPIGKGRLKRKLINLSKKNK